MPNCSGCSTSATTMPLTARAAPPAIPIWLSAVNAACQFGECRQPPEAESRKIYITNSKDGRTLITLKYRPTALPVPDTTLVTSAI